MNLSAIKRQMVAGDRAFVRREEIILVECFTNETNNVNDARDRVFHEVRLALKEIEVPEAAVPDALQKVIN